MCIRMWMLGCLFTLFHNLEPRTSPTDCGRATMEEREGSLPSPIPAGLVRQIQNRRQDCLIILFTSNLNSSSSGLQFLRTHRLWFRNRDEIQKPPWQQTSWKAANHTAQTTTDSKQRINRNEHCKQKKELGLIQVHQGPWNWTKNISLKCK